MPSVSELEAGRSRGHLSPDHRYDRRACYLLVRWEMGTLTVSGTQSGVTSQYLGANEVSSQFNINDLVDLGISSYRIYRGISRWEPTNAESTYGSPTIAQIEANPAVINWASVSFQIFYIR